jgi:CDP-diacylglycerol--serine O-phosphatidyltransferase
LNDKDIVKPFPFISLIPNLFTLLSLAIGVNAIRLAIDGNWELAVGSIIISSIIDGIDGRIARLLNASSKFGAELDSLCDLVNFGVAPALMIYFWVSNSVDAEFQKLSWTISIIFILCMSIRLARFNADLNVVTNIDKRSKIFFKGVPAPAGGLLMLLPIILDFKLAKMFGYDLRSHIVIIDIYSIIIAFLLPSRIPTFSFKSINVEPEYIWLALLLSGIFIVSLTIYTWYVMPIIAIIYITSIFFSIAYAKKIN